MRLTLMAIGSEIQPETGLCVLNRACRRRITIRNHKTSLSLCFRYYFLGLDVDGGRQYR